MLHFFLRMKGWSFLWLFFFLAKLIQFCISHIFQCPNWCARAGSSRMLKEQESQISNDEFSIRSIDTSKLGPEV
uniref:Putative secreted protein n=1 Tax=Anopheles darlingi TaxID=43151 RepID=A0A2M4DGI1_ANODA